jgi:aryl sulfotransferase
MLGVWVARGTKRGAAPHEEVPITETTAWPRKTRELHNHHFDSAIWNDLQFRDDGIIIATYAKSGTTWMPQIIAQMLWGPDRGLRGAEMSPWLDLRVPPKAVKLPVGRHPDPGGCGGV